MSSMNVEYFRIKELLEKKWISTVSPSIKLQKDDIKKTGITPVISQDQEFIMGYTDFIDEKLMNAPYIIFGDHTEVFKYIKAPFVQGADGIKIIKVNDLYLHPLYLYYALKKFYYPTGFYERHFKLLKKVFVPNYKYEKQKKIAKILENYDQLIENNNKRIKLLENMAEEIYKEWFVRFKFPELNRAKLKKIKLRGWTYGDNKKELLIPENWDYGELANLGIFKRGKNITSSEMIEGDIKVISAGLEPSGKHNEYNVEGYNLTISASGANAGYLSYHLENIWAADCSYYDNKENIWFVYNSLKFLEPLIRNMQIGSAQPHVYAKNINRIPVIIPSDDLLKKFELHVTPIYDEIKLLNNENINLEKQRDSLLPRLMSGILSVEGKEVI